MREQRACCVDGAAGEVARSATDAAARKIAGEAILQEI